MRSNTGQFKEVYICNFLKNDSQDYHTGANGYAEAGAHC